MLAEHSPQKVFVALHDGEPVAALELTLAAGVGGIYNLSTRLPHRRRGIGGALLERACRRAARSAALIAPSRSPARSRRGATGPGGVLPLCHAISGRPTVSDKIYYVK